MRLFAILPIFILLVLQIAAPSAAANTCGLPDEAGRWVNPQAKDKGDLTLIVVQHDCDTKGADQWMIRARVKCPRRDCIWGFGGGKRAADGTLVALIKTFAADRWLVLRVANDQLIINVMNEYRSGNTGPRRQAAQMIRADE